MRYTTERSNTYPNFFHVLDESGICVAPNVSREFAEYIRRINMPEGLLEPKDIRLNITDDLTDIRCVIAVMVEKLNEGGKKSRERSLVVTKLQEASMWANEALMLE